MTALTPTRYEVRLALHEPLLLSQARGEAVAVHDVLLTVWWAPDKPVSVGVHGHVPGPGGGWTGAQMVDALARTPQDLEATNPGLLEHLRAAAPFAPWVDGAEPA